MAFYKRGAKNDLLLGCDFRMLIEVNDFELKRIFQERGTYFIYIFYGLPMDRCDIPETYSCKISLFSETTTGIFFFFISWFF